MASLNTQKWASEVNRILFEQKDYTSMSKNFNEMVNSSKFTIPNAGTVTVALDDYSRPLTASERTDTANEISLQDLRTDPYYVQIDETFELAYDKRASILQSLADGINDQMKQRIYWSWINDADMTNYSIKTTGVSGATMPSDASGTRLKLTYDDIIKATEYLDNQNIPNEGRIMLVNSSMIKDLKQMDEFERAETLSDEVIRSGQIGMIDGIKIIRANTPSVLVNAVASGSTASGVTYGATGTTYSYVASIFHPDYVVRVVANSNLFINMKDALHTSDVMTLTQRFGGGLLRKDKKGFVTIVQEIGA